MDCSLSGDFFTWRAEAGNSVKVTPGVVQTGRWADREKEEDATGEEKARNDGVVPRTSVGETRENELIPHGYTGVGVVCGRRAQGWGGCQEPERWAWRQWAKMSKFSKDI